MSQPHQKQLLDHPKILSRSQSQGNSPTRNRARPVATGFEEEMRAMPTPSIERRNTISNLPIRFPNIGTYVPTTDCLERLYQVTDIVLVICGIVVIIAVLLSIGIGILGISRKLNGLGYYTKSNGLE